MPNAGCGGAAARDAHSEGVAAFVARDLAAAHAAFERAHLALNQREWAVRAIGRGLELWPEDPRLLAAREAMGTRRAPVIPFLARSNPLNRVLGQLRHRWPQRNGPAHELSPVTLGVPLPDRGRDDADQGG